VSQLNYWKRACFVSVICAAAAIVSPAQTFTTLAAFTGTNGSNPEYTMLLVQGMDGSLYGTTLAGGANANGTVFKVTATGVLTTLYNFCTIKSCIDGAEPYAGLVLSTDGNFYGTTSNGGPIYAGGNYNGTVFQITVGGTLTTLHDFAFNDGAHPWGVLVQATDGNFYSTTSAGGTSNACGATGCGAIFKMSPGGILARLSFDLTHGAQPYDGLVQGTDGNFYGTTSGGGANANGTVFKITPGGALTTLYSFDGIDGLNPYAALIQAVDGNFYGTTRQGGSGSACGGFGCGTVFKITSSGTLTTLYSFDGVDGSYPITPLVQATDGTFYGTTDGGGGSGRGTIFKITASGTLTTLYNFCSETACSDGFHASGLIQSTDGVLYGTTYFGGPNAGGGDYGRGTIFSLNLGLGPFVKTLPTSGKLGRTVIILGANLAGATSVTFNGVRAAFTIISDSAINTTVPAGATTGPVQVTILNGTLASNIVFRVTP
jgi:uncharacterized repeat protein (TIGR03803 family)